MPLAITTQADPRNAAAARPQCPLRGVFPAAPLCPECWPPGCEECVPYCLLRLFDQEDHEGS